MIFFFFKFLHIKEICICIQKMKSYSVLNPRPSLTEKYRKSKKKKNNEMQHKIQIIFSRELIRYSKRFLPFYFFLVLIFFFLHRTRFLLRYETGKDKRIL
jgi:ATP-dependent Zn protease